MNRRDFARTLAAGGASTPALYYVDGYHGGSRGHMPAAAWRDVLNALRANPQWKLSLDIEPASWDGLRREDPQAYQEFRRMLLQKPLEARIDIYAVQEPCWSSCLDQILRSLGFTAAVLKNPGTPARTCARPGKPSS